MQYTIKTTSTYDTWFKKPIDNTIAELRFFFGGGYRIYYLVDGENIILLLNGGNKSNQNNDIEKAKSILKALQKERL